MAVTIPAINGMSADVVITAKVLDNFVQGDCEKDNRGVYGGYEAGELQAQEIRILKPTFLPILTRTLGATVNGNPYASGIVYISNDEFRLRVVDVYDTPIEVPYNNLAMAPQLKIDDWSKQIGLAVAVIKNGLCLATKFFRSFYTDFANANVHTFDKSSGKIVDSFALCNDDMDIGDAARGIDSFPEDGRRFLIASGVLSYLLKNGSFIVGGSNYAQDMLSLGAVSPSVTPNALMDGYKGLAFNTPVNLISDMKVRYADECLGFPDGTLKSCGFLAVESSALANQFGLVDNGVVSSPSPRGQGTLLKPNHRVGASTFFTKGNSWIMDSAYVNPFYVYDTIFSAAYTPAIISRASRAAIGLTAVVTSPATGKFVVNANKTYYDPTGLTVGTTVSANADVAKFAVIDSTTKVYATVGEFIAAVKTGGESATVKLASDLNTQISSTANHFVSVLAICTDGTLSAIGTVKVIA